MKVQLRTTHLPGYICPHCLKKLDAATSFDGDVPEVGTSTVCIYCERILIFTEVGLRATSEAEADDIRRNSPGMRRILSFLARRKAMKG
jgi:hypothetical protein